MMNRSKLDTANTKSGLMRTVGSLTRDVTSPHGSPQRPRSNKPDIWLVRIPRGSDFFFSTAGGSSDAISFAGPA